MAPQPVAFLGDAVHTAHFSVGSGTKMAMEDAVALSAALAAHPGDLAAALATYEEAAQPSVRKIQDSARPSLSWWEHFGRYHDAFEPWQFAYHFLSRSISDARLARRAPTSWLRATGAGWTLTVPSRSRLRSNAVDGRRRAVWSRFERTEAMPVAVVPGTCRSLSEDPRPGPWGAVLAAPDSETGLPGVAAQLGELARLDIPPVLVAVHGGTTLTRMLVCEQIRLHERMPALLIDPDAADDVDPRPGGDRRAVRPRGPRRGYRDDQRLFPTPVHRDGRGPLRAVRAARDRRGRGLPRPEQARRDAGPLTQRLRRARRPPGAGERPRRDDASVVAAPPTQAPSISP